MSRPAPHARRPDPDLAQLERNAAKAAGLLKLLANEKRLLILCQLAAAKELSVGSFAEAVDLSQSALSQHLSRMREEGLVDTRRQAQTVHYHLANANAARVLTLLKGIFCP